MVLLFSFISHFRQSLVVIIFVLSPILPFSQRRPFLIRFSFVGEPWLLHRRSSRTRMRFVGPDQSIYAKASELVPCSLLPHWNSMRFFATVSLYDSNSMDEVKSATLYRGGHVTNIVTCTLLCCDWIMYVLALWNFQKSWLWTLLLRQKNTPLFLFPYMGCWLQMFAWGMPLHAHVFSFTHNALVLSQYRCVQCSPRKSDENFSILTFLLIKTNVAYTILEVIAKQRSALQVEFITGVKLICYFVLYYCSLHWAHPPNMAVGDLDFYYTLYLWFMLTISHRLSCSSACNAFQEDQYFCNDGMSQNKS